MKDIATILNLHKFLVIFALAFSCTSKEATDDSRYLTPVFEFINSNDTISYKELNNSNFFTCTYSHQYNRNKEITNTYLYLNTKDTVVYFDLKNWFLSEFGSSLSHQSTDYWKQDDKEYLLHKQDDSTIFVNIYRK